MSKPLTQIGLVKLIPVGSSAPWLRRRVLIGARSDWRSGVLNIQYEAHRAELLEALLTGPRDGVESLRWPARRADHIYARIQPPRASVLKLPYPFSHPIYIDRLMQLYYLSILGRTADSAHNPDHLAEKSVCSGFTLTAVNWKRLAAI